MTLSTVDKVESTLDKVECASTLTIRTAHSGFRDARHDFSVVRQKTRGENGRMPPFLL